MKTKIFLRVTRLLLFIVISCCSTKCLFSQSLKEVTGTVRSDSGQLAGVSVSVKNNPSLGTVTNENGNFSIKAPENSTLVFTSVGYKTIERPVNGQSSISVLMEATSGSLSDVVVVGYGTQKKATLSGAVSVVKGDEIAKSPAAEVSNAFAGRVPGVIATNNSGQPGNDGSKIYIRGISTYSGATRP